MHSRHQKTERINLATELPSPPKLSERDWEQVHKEADAWRAAAAKGLETLERLTAEDWAAVIR